MKVLVFPHHLEIGGSQTNAIDLATAVRDRHGHDIVFCATPGPAGELLAERGFRLIELPMPRSAPSPTLMRAVRRIAIEEQPDLLHAYDWQQILDAFYGVHLRDRLPMLGTVMSMAVLRLPRSLPLTYGTAGLVEEARGMRSGPVSLIEPPVDTDANAPGAVDEEPFRLLADLQGPGLVIAVVSRLTSWLKLEGISRAIQATGQLAVDHDLTFVIVGGGPMHDTLAAEARQVNDAAGRRVVLLTGPMLDPRPAYQAADIVIGMGGSMIRGMSFAKPAVVLGEGGFSEIFDESTSPLFLNQGFYGVGAPGHSSDLVGQLRRLVDDPELRSKLGSYAHEQAVARFGLDASADNLNLIYTETLSHRVPLGRECLDGTIVLGELAARRAKALAIEAHGRDANRPPDVLPPPVGARGFRPVRCRSAKNDGTCRVVEPGNPKLCTVPAPIAVR